MAFSNWLMTRSKPDMRTAAWRILLLFGAALSTTVALFILVTTGLPQRAEFTGQMIPDSTPIAAEIGALAPDFQLQSTTGESIRLSDLRGQPVIVNFWATWCGPCVVEMPTLQSLYEARRQQGLRILAVNIGEPAQAVREWQADYGLTYDILIDEAQQVSTLYRLRGQPSTYVISPEGIIIDIFFGPVDINTLKAVLG